MSWISITDKLPPYDDHVLATDGETVEKAFLFLDVFDRSVWTYQDWTAWKGVTHWMELPQMPRIHD